MLISIIIPVYNKESYIDKCLTSVNNQTYEKIEIIIINDGSTDNSDSIIKNWISKDSRIRYFKQENQGVAKARNMGLEYATGEYIFFLDADDYLIEDAIYCFVNNLNNVEADIIIGNYYEYKQKLYKKSSHETRLYMPKELNQLDTIIDMFIDNGRAMAMAGNKLYKADFLKKISIEFKKNIISEDRLFNLMCYVNNPSILLIEEYTYVYNIIEDSRSRKVNPNYYRESISLFFLFHKYLSSNSKLKDYQNLLKLILVYDLYKIINHTFENSKTPIKDTNNIIKKMRNNKLIFSTVLGVYSDKDIKIKKGYKFFNHMLVIGFLFLYTPKLILVYKSIGSLLRCLKVSKKSIRHS